MGEFLRNTAAALGVGLGLGVGLSMGFTVANEALAFFWVWVM